MDKQKLLIADPEEDYCIALCAALQDRYQTKWVEDGVRALKLMQDDPPDILILDPMLPELDGMTLLQTAIAQNIRPAVLMTVCYASDFFINAAEKLGVSYLMRKPCPVSTVSQRVDDIAHFLKAGRDTSRGSRTQVSDTLLRMGFPSKLRGYGYLREAVLIMAKDPGQSITKELYPAVATQCGASPTQIERSIRNAICTAWQQRDQKVWKTVFPTQGTAAVRPTNAALICALADRLSLLTPEHIPSSGDIE